MAEKKSNKSSSIDGKRRLAENRQARYEYEIFETLETGLELLGTEVKSIKDSKVSFSSGFCFFKKDEIYVKGLQISEYVFGNSNNHDPMREKKLLLNKNEIIKLKKNFKEKKLLIIPKRLFVNDRGIAKLEIALARGKKDYDKRKKIEEKRVSKEIRDYK